MQESNFSTNQMWKNFINTLLNFEHMNQQEFDQQTKLSYDALFKKHLIKYKIKQPCECVESIIIDVFSQYRKEKYSSTIIQNLIDHYFYKSPLSTKSEKFLIKQLYKIKKDIEESKNIVNPQPYRGSEFVIVESLRELDSKSSEDKLSDLAHLVLVILDDKGYIEHGISLRCAWLSTLGNKAIAKS